MAAPLTLVRFAGPCWRAVTTGGEAAVLTGSDRAGRYNRPGERTLYMSGSRAGVAAAMARYGDAARTVVELDVRADGLIDLRDPSAAAALGVDMSRAREDWIAALDRGEEPPSWRVADAARAMGAAGLIDGSRRAPGEWHLVLFRWNVAGGARVAVVEASGCMMATVTLWRPVGPVELALIEASGMRAFPPRLPEQPIFYPVVTEDYAIKIARDWNVRDSGAGFVTRFEVRADFLANYRIEDAGGRAHREYWIPATELPAFNAAIVGSIEVTHRFS